MTKILGKTLPYTWDESGRVSFGRFTFMKYCGYCANSTASRLYCITVT